MGRRVVTPAALTTSRRRRQERLVSAVLAGVMVVVAAVAMWAIQAAGHAERSAQRSHLLADTLDRARFDIAQQESLERKYRLDPSPAVRIEHSQAARDLDADMAAYAAIGGAGQRSVADRILSADAQYGRASEALFDATDRGRLADAEAIDKLRSDPAIATLENAVYVSADRQNKATTIATHVLQRTQRTGAVSTGIALVLGMVLMVGLRMMRRRWRREVELQSRRNAHDVRHDALTGLPNRVGFAELLQAALRDAETGGKPLGLLVLDLDRFKEVNDGLGHQVGDDLLGRIGPRLRRELRTGDVVARLAGDEFALLLRDDATTDQPPGEAFRTTAERALRVLAEPFPLDDLSLVVEASAGLVIHPTHGDTAEVLRQRANTAMHVAKRMHSGIEVYDPALDEHTPRRLGLLGELREAIRAGQLVLHYQPVVDGLTGQAVGVEALVRWQHPAHGLLGPGEFIPVAERSNVIHELTAHVLERALGQCQEWSLTGRELRVGVNVSARCLLDAGFYDSVISALTRAAVDPDLLILEITETATVADPVRARAVLTKLHQAGVHLSIDDFGTGYTSLAYLRDLPVDALKIDRSFVAKMLTSPSDAVIVRATVELAARLGMSAVAEGIEDAATHRALQALGCPRMQGYLYSRPLPPAEIEDWLTRNATAVPAGELPRQEQGRRASTAPSGAASPTVRGRSAN